MRPMRLFVVVLCFLSGCAWIDQFIPEGYREWAEEIMVKGYSCYYDKETGRGHQINPVICPKEKPEEGE